MMDDKKISGLGKITQMNTAENQPSVSVVVVNKDGINFVGECLASVLRSTYDNFEVIFVDNGSIDRSADFVKSNFNDRKLQVIRLKTNVGLDEASNIGARSSSSEYVIFLNSDTMAHPDWIQGLVTALEKDVSIGAAQSKVLMMNDPTRIDSLGTYVDRFGDTLRKGSGEYDDGRFSSPEEIFYAGGTVTIIRRDLYLKIGGFRRYFFIMHEDVDLGWRVWLSGHRVMCVPSSVVYHRRGGSTSRVYPLVMFHSTKNRISTMIQNYELSNILRYVPLRTIIDFGTSLRNIYNKNLEIAISILRGLLWNVVNFKTVWRTHEEVKYRVRRITDMRILFRMVSNGIPYAMVILHVFPFTRRLLTRYMRWNLQLG
jgi:hypothetical protein